MKKVSFQPLYHELSSRLSSRANSFGWHRLTRSQRILSAAIATTTFGYIAYAYKSVKHHDTAHRMHHASGGHADFGESDSGGDQRIQYNDGSSIASSKSHPNHTDTSTPTLALQQNDDVKTDLEGNAPIGSSMDHFYSNDSSCAIEDSESPVIDGVNISPTSDPTAQPLTKNSTVSTSASTIGIPLTAIKIPAAVIKPADLTSLSESVISPPSMPILVPLSVTSTTAGEGSTFLALTRQQVELTRPQTAEHDESANPDSLSGHDNLKVKSVKSDPSENESSSSALSSLTSASVLPPHQPIVPLAIVPVQPKKDELVGSQVKEPVTLAAAPVVILAPTSNASVPASSTAPPINTSCPLVTILTPVSLTSGSDGGMNLLDHFPDSASWMVHPSVHKHRDIIAGHSRK